MLQLRPVTPDVALTGRISEIVSHTPGCSLDVLIRECGEFTWNQVFLEIDRLTRRGEVTLRRERSGYTVHPGVAVPCGSMAFREAI